MYSLKDFQVSSSFHQLTPFIRSKIMPKRDRNLDCIDGLNHQMIEDEAASFSYDRGLALQCSVVIDSHTEGNVDASISGKHYDISITYTPPVRSSLDISCDCSCPDDRDGSCKHICAVLLKLIDCRPKAKKSKSTAPKASKSKSKKYSLSELKDAVGNLSEDQLAEILKEALQFKGVQKIVSQKLNVIGNQCVDLRSIKGDIYEAIHQLDSLRPSQQFSMSYKVDQDLGKVINTANKYWKSGNTNAAMQILLALAKSVSNEHNIEGEVWKSIHSGGGIDYDIASLMKEIIGEDEVLQSNEQIKTSIRSLHCTMSAYCVEDYGEVLQCFDAEE